MTFHNHRPLPRLVASGGPVSRALLVMTEADPELARIRALRRAIADRIEADLALLDALAGDPDVEDGGDHEPSLCGLTVSNPCLGGDDREEGDDNGVADSGGSFEQARRFVDMGGDLRRATRYAGRCL